MGTLQVKKDNDEADKKDREKKEEEHKFFWRNNEKMERRKMIKKIFLKTLTIKYLIFFTILNILYANDKDFRPQKNIFNKINDYYLKDSYNYYGT